MKRLLVLMLVLFVMLSFAGCRFFSENLLNLAADNKETIIDVSCGNGYTLFHTSKGNVYAAGYNQLDILALGSEGRLDKPVKVYKKGDAKLIKAGDMNTVIVNEKNDILLSGVDFFQEIDSEKTAAIYSQRVSLPFEHGDVKEVAVSGMHLHVLTADGRVFAYGQNHNGQMGLKSERENEFALIPFENKIIQICASNTYSLFLDEKGRLFGCGILLREQLDFQTDNKRMEPKFLMEDVSMVSGGYATFFVLNKVGEVFVMGSNQFGEAGTLHEDDFILKFTKLDFGINVKIKKVRTAYYGRGIAVSENDDVYYWGENTSKSNPDLPDKKILHPTRWGTPFAVEDVFPGSPGLILTNQSGEFYAYGNNHDGLMAVSDHGVLTEPIKITMDVLSK